MFIRCGIKCENHSAAVILVKKLFKLNDLYIIFSKFKTDKMDNQYYVPITETEPINKEECAKRIKIAKEFNMKIRAYKDNLNDKEINNIREEFLKIY